MYLLRAVTMDDIQVDGRVRNFMSAQMRKQRQELLTQAIAAGQQVAFTYVHTDGVTTRRVVTPQSVSEMEYQGYSYLGLQAQCHLRERPRVFSLSRMFELEVVESK
ncbi:MAG: WYL domain-containing protein [Candidatus Peribacteria bacterium]|nr:MAG: WYL domain-containing protein [Candidatus Peribacteria bacterium]